MTILYISSRINRIELTIIHGYLLFISDTGSTCFTMAIFSDHTKRKQRKTFKREISWPVQITHDQRRLLHLPVPVVTNQRLTQQINARSGFAREVHLAVKFHSNKCK